MARVLDSQYRFMPDNVSPENGQRIYREKKKGKFGAAVTRLGAFIPLLTGLGARSTSMDAAVEMNKQFMPTTMHEPGIAQSQQGARSFGVKPDTLGSYSGREPVDCKTGNESTLKQDLSGAKTPSDETPPTPAPTEAATLAVKDRVLEIPNRRLTGPEFNVFIELAQAKDNKLFTGDSDFYLNDFYFPLNEGADGSLTVSAFSSDDLPDL